MNGQFDLVVSETAQRCVKGAVTDWAMPGSHRREEISRSVSDFLELAKNGESLRRQRHTVWPSHLHLFGGYAPFPVSQAELGSFRLSHLSRSHKDQRSQ